MSSETLTLHPKQGKAFESDHKVTLCTSGIQGGKTTVGALWLLKENGKWQDGGEHNYIVGAPTYKILNQSTIPGFMRYHARFGSYLKGPSEFKYHNGGTVYFRTSTDPDSIEGITNVRAAWLDEAGKCKYAFWINLEGRCARTAAPIMCTTTPYGLNWPYKHLIKPVEAGERKDVLWLKWRSVDNPSFPRAEYERQRQILDPKIFQRRYEGEHVRLEGLVYDLTKDNFFDQKDSLPEETVHYGGIDFGYAEGHEFAASIRGLTPDGLHVVVSTFKQSGLTPDQQCDIILARTKIHKVKKWFCDPSRPDLIALFRKAGIPCAGFQEGKENFKKINPGIEAHNELIRSGKYKIPNDKHLDLEDEYETYHWPQDMDGEIANEVPVKDNDHFMDAERMLTVGTLGLMVERKKGLTGSRSLVHYDAEAQKLLKNKRRANRSFDEY